MVRTKLWLPFDERILAKCTFSQISLKCPAIQMTQSTLPDSVRGQALGCVHVQTVCASAITVRNTTSFET